ncbi:MAG: radical SAM protein [Polyangiaceae bacterium]
MALVLVDRLLRRGVTPVREVPPKPERIFWWWEQICNLSCNHCDIGRRTKSYQLTPKLDLKDKLTALERLHRFVGKPFSLSFIAGEPFLHPDLLDAVARATELGITTSVTTNGTLLATAGRAERVVQAGLSFVAVSVDSADAEYHDRTRGRRGTHALARRSIQQLREARERLGRSAPVVWVNSIIMRDNLDGLLQLSDWVREEGIQGHSFQPVATTDFFMGERPQGDRWFEQSALFPEPAAALAFVEELQRRKASGYPIQNSDNDFRQWRAYFEDPVAFGSLESCESELKTLLVTHTGHVKMCPNTRESFGHVLRDDLDDMWVGRAAGRAREHVYECKSQCKILANTKEDFYF